MHKKDFFTPSLMPPMNLMKITEVWKKVHLLMDLMLVKLFGILYFWSGQMAVCSKLEWLYIAS